VRLAGFLFNKPIKIKQPISFSFPLAEQAIQGHDYAGQPPSKWPSKLVKQTQQTKQEKSGKLELNVLAPNIRFQPQLEASFSSVET